MKYPYLVKKDGKLYEPGSEVPEEVIEVEKPKKETSETTKKPKEKE